MEEILFFYSGNWTFITSLDKIKFSCVTIETSRSDEGTFSRRRLVENFVMWVRNREGIQAWMPSRPPPRHHSAFFYLNYTVMASVFDPVSATLGQESRHQFYWVAQHCTLLCPPASKKKKISLIESKFWRPSPSVKRSTTNCFKLRYGSFRFPDLFIPYNGKHSSSQSNYRCEQTTTYIWFLLKRAYEAVTDQELTF